MTTHKLTANGGLFGVNWLTWIVFAFAFAWCFAFFLMRKPPSPWAFDLPAAQLPRKPTNAWQLLYPATIVNCGATVPAWCANYCDEQSTIRYIECTEP